MDKPLICVGVMSYHKLAQDPEGSATFAKSENNGKTHKYIPGTWEAKTNATELDPFHTHFLMVEDSEGADDNTKARQVRAEFERYLSSNDVSGDGIQTPKVVLVMSGGIQTFKQVRDALDPTDPSTGTSVPVLVITNTGNAAEDIAYYAATGKFNFEQNPTEERNDKYKEVARMYIPEIVALGKQTGPHARPRALQAQRRPTVAAKLMPL